MKDFAVLEDRRIIDNLSLSCTSIVRDMEILDPVKAQPKNRHRGKRPINNGVVIRLYLVTDEVFYKRPNKSRVEMIDCIIAYIHVQYCSK